MALKKKKGNSKYMQKYKKRLKEANSIGNKAFYHNKEGRRIPYPMPLMGV